MTVCIAAACFHDPKDKKRRIVMCSDTKLTSSLGSMEGSLKQVFLPNGWCCLTSGNEPDILALVRLYKAQFKDKANLQAETIDASIKAPLYRRKSELAEEYVQRHLGRSYDYFLKHGKDDLTAEHFFDISQKIARLDLGTSLILTGFIDDEPEIYYTDSDGTAKAAAYYAVIGEGEYVAHSAPLRRGHYDAYFLDQTVDHVYEAKTLAEYVSTLLSG